MEEALNMQPTAGPLKKDLFAVTAWNDDKHSFDGAIRHLADCCNCSLEEAANLAHNIDEQA